MKADRINRIYSIGAIAAIALGCSVTLPGCSDPLFLDIVTAPVALYCAASDSIQNARSATPTPSPTPHSARRNSR